MSNPFTHAHAADSVMMRPSEDQDLNRLALMVGWPEIDNEKTASSREVFIKVFQ